MDLIGEFHYIHWVSRLQGVLAELRAATENVMLDGLFVTLLRRLVSMQG
jgi:hypothetical protein